MKQEVNRDVITLLNSVISTYTGYMPDKGISIDEFRMDKIPTDDVVSFATENEYDLVCNRGDVRIQAAKKLLGATRSTNAILYPPHSKMAWHTNSDIIGRRIYYTYTEGKAMFRYRDIDGTIKEDWDNVGWTTRSFTINPNQLFWHSVWTEKRRFAFGFNVDAEPN